MPSTSIARTPKPGNAYFPNPTTPALRASPFHYPKFVLLISSSIPFVPSHSSSQNHSQPAPLILRTVQVPGTPFTNPQATPCALPHHHLPINTTRHARNRTEFIRRRDHRPVGLVAREVRGCDVWVAFAEEGGVQCRGGRNSRKGPRGSAMDGRNE
jgi:hypothetical protein